MVRAFTTVTAEWASGSPTSSALAVPWGHMAGGILHISGAVTTGKIGIQVNVFNSWLPVVDWQGGYTGVSINAISGNAAHECPPSWFYLNRGDHKVKLWSHDGSGSGLAQTGAHLLVMDLKS